jgi:penicillin-binding protein 1A
MYERGYIDKKTYQSAIVEPISASYHGQFVQSRAQYVGEMVRDAMYAHFGEETYTKGYKVYTTLNSQLQKDANHALRGALLAYDQRHGYRGPSGDLHGNPTSSSVLTKWQDELEDIPEVGGLESAAVTTVNGHSVLALLGDGKTIEIPWHGLEWARRVYKDGAFGRTPSEASDILHVGNIIRVIKMADGSYRLAQIPEVEGAFVAVNPQDGAIMALVGGFDFSKSKYNRVTQSLRQPGSGFKPFVYAAALDRGFTLASLINDNPIEINDPATHSVWRPQNDTRQYYGPTRLRVCLSKSRNLASVHLLQDIGMGYALRYTTRFGFERSQIPRNLTMVLGTGVVSPLQMAAGYAVFANGGYKINPYIIARIDDAGNHTLYQSKPRLACSTCIVGTTVPTLVANTQPQAYPATPVNRTAIVPSIPVVQQAPQVISPQIAFLMNTALQDVIRHGTGRGAMILNRNDLAGKTGTTQEMRDAWFSGYNGDIVATAWVGYDNDPRSLDEHGAQAALPMWINFMQRFLQGRPEHAMPQPPGIVTAAIDPNTGKLAGEGEPGAIPEVFLVNHLPGDGGPTDNPNPGDVELSAPVL